MLELNLIRENPEIVRKALADRQMDAVTSRTGVLPGY